MQNGRKSGNDTFCRLSVRTKEHVYRFDEGALNVKDCGVIVGVSRILTRIR